jgi:hypothetical protein
MVRVNEKLRASRICQVVFAAALVACVGIRDVAASDDTAARAERAAARAEAAANRSEAAAERVERAVERLERLLEALTEDAAERPPAGRP